MLEAAYFNFMAVALKWACKGPYNTSGKFIFSIFESTLLHLTLPP